jgi:hypothetical protein
MRRNTLMTRVQKTLLFTALILGGLSSSFASGGEDSLTREITYQGRLTYQGVPVNTPQDLIFKIYSYSNEEETYTLLSYGEEDAVITKPSVDINDGLFSVNLEFDESLFNGNDRYIQVIIDVPNTTSDIEFAKERLTCVPYAYYALDAQVDNTSWSGTDLSVSNGGTGLSSVPNQQVLFGSTTTALASSSDFKWEGSRLSVARAYSDDIGTTVFGAVGNGIFAQNSEYIHLTPTDGANGTAVQIRGYHEPHIDLTDFNGGWDVGVHWNYSTSDTERWRQTCLMGDLSGTNAYQNNMVFQSGNSKYPVIMDYESGNVGINLPLAYSVPRQALEVNGVLRLNQVSTAPTDPGSGACLYAYSDGTHTRLYVIDGEDNHTLLSSHTSPRKVNPNARTSFDDLNIELPWSFHHKNTLIGKGAIVDIAKAMKWIEEKMQDELGQDEGQLFNYYDLPQEEISSVDQFFENQVDSLIQQRIAELGPVEVKLRGNGSIPDECFEMVEKTTLKEVEKEIEVKEIDFQSKKVVSVKKNVTTTEQIGTGEFESQLKEGYTFEDGKVYRQPTIDDIDISPEDIPALSDWIANRANTNSNNQSVDEATIEQIKSKYK